MLSAVVVLDTCPKEESSVPPLEPGSAEVTHPLVCRENVGQTHQENVLHSAPG